MVQFFGGAGQFDARAAPGHRAADRRFDRPPAGRTRAADSELELYVVYSLTSGFANPATSARRQIRRTRRTALFMGPPSASAFTKSASPADELALVSDRSRGGLGIRAPPWKQAKSQPLDSSSTWNRTIRPPKASGVARGIRSIRASPRARNLRGAGDWAAMQKATTAFLTGFSPRA